MTVYTTMNNPLGELLLVGEAAPEGGTVLTSLSFPGQSGAPVVQAGWRRDDAAFFEAAGQLEDYFAGRLREFDLHCASNGTPFQEKVWAALETVPYGTTTTYGALAERVGLARSAARAVGAALGANPLLVLRPCHRVLSSGGALTGYAAGLQRKAALLAGEGVRQNAAA
ncbi:methylated-DNA--[protein]-cysteine S-methyltransferase [Streptomyces sp. NPDC059783]|uniref:methylated-DNA--[protein]-cysteine S-methyltransferase n=1 Tax=Streptomyces sp. NPDC059783 TaxID=3346944 RepID=UPI00366A2152